MAAVIVSAGEAKSTFGGISYSNTRSIHTIRHTQAVPGAQPWHPMGIPDRLRWLGNRMPSGGLQGSFRDLQVLWPTSQSNSLWSCHSRALSDQFDQLRPSANQRSARPNIDQSCPRMVA